MKRILYVDLPFEGIKGGDKNRSRFLWETLRNHFCADLLLLKTQAFNTKPLPPHSGYQKSFSLVVQNPAFYQAQAIHHFHPSQLRKFEKVLLAERYELIVFRFLSCYYLASKAKEILPDTPIAIDVDMLFSRIAELSWAEEKSLRNRYHLLEMLKLKAFEKKAFQEDFQFFFTNPTERQMAIDAYALPPERACLSPNMMPVPSSAGLAAQAGAYILFFGSLDSMANQDAFQYLTEEIYPLVESDLERLGIRIVVAGKGQSDLHTGHGCKLLDLVGEVDDMAAWIAGSKIVILPLRIASGTRTRILEAAALSKAVLTTSLGNEGLDLQELYICDQAEDFAGVLLSALQNEEELKRMGQRLYEQARANYAPEVVAERLLLDLDAGEKGECPEPEAVSPVAGLRIALVTNRFFPEVGGAETNIYYQARLLAKRHRLTVFCPKRQQDSKSSRLEGFEVLRLPDLLNLPPKYPNLKAKTLCPSLFWYLLTGDFDIIQVFPALNYNNMLAFLAAKLRRIPFILCFFDFIDYAGLIEEKGSINPNVLKNIQVPWYQKIILKNLDQAFAIAGKEIDFLRKFNPRVEYSPVPILPEEFEGKYQDPRSSLGIAAGDFVFLCLGRVSQLKGQDIALKAFAQVARSIPEAKLVFVGRVDYEPNFFSGLQGIVTDHNLQDRVFFTGMLDRDVVVAWLKTADIHVIPVRFMNSGAVVVESWISDTPVLQSDVVDPNLVEEGVNGYLFRTQDHLDCATKMRLAYQKRELLPALAARGKQLVLQKYTYEYLINLYEKTYKYLLES